ncbi:CaiB/BaiF CoA transferase family protein [Limobrevibacterium gyesilva]|uniref:CoA transferase n=1 Tax=Limobrevibacterium gyesilva TaxID=2991712 RepID=A0AA42CD04_9PROT|nr:CaiB/BaiF CoA-transferase family protein [Limobrevibacterium gyesilva]MCW3473044.1 CoA transferase [Limobrevibacterium gyesilva]
MGTLPLAGIRVVEFVHMVMGPTCGLVLADLGADVIKVEPAPEGDNTRRLGGSGAGFFAFTNRNKRSLAVDLKSAEGMALVKRLLATADVMVENFRPGAMDKLGLGYADVAALNPRLVYCSCKGFLPGPYENRVALDEVVQMMGGLAYMTGMPGRPLRAGSSVNDIMGGMFGAIGILAALNERHATGKGRLVQSGLFENNVLLVAQHMAQFAATGKEAPPMTQRLPAWPIYDIFEVSDGQVFIGVVTDTQWKVFCEAFGMTALAEDPTLSTQRERVEARERTIPIVAEALRGFTRDGLMARCEALGLPYAPISRPVELFDDPHLNNSGGLVPVTLPNGALTKLPALPLSLDGERPGLRHDLPKPGEHGAEIARELGYSERDIAAMRAAGRLV